MPSGGRAMQRCLARVRRGDGGRASGEEALDGAGDLLLCAAIVHSEQRRVALNVLRVEHGTRADESSHGGRVEALGGAMQRGAAELVPINVMAITVIVIVIVVAAAASTALQQKPLRVLEHFLNLAAKARGLSILAALQA